MNENKHGDAGLLLEHLVDLVARALAPLVADELATRSTREEDQARPSRLLTLDELVAELPPGKRPATWKRWLYERTRRGEVPGCFKIGGRLFFDMDQVQAWLESGAAPSVPIGTIGDATGLAAAPH